MDEISAGNDSNPDYSKYEFSGQTSPLCSIINRMYKISQFNTSSY